MVQARERPAGGCQPVSSGPVQSLGLCPQKPVSAVGRRQPQDADPGLTQCSGVQGVHPGIGVKPQLRLQPALGGPQLLPRCLGELWDRS